MALRAGRGAQLLKAIEAKKKAKEEEARIRKNSVFGNLVTWKLFRIMVKSNDEVRQD